MKAIGIIIITISILTNCISGQDTIESDVPPTYSLRATPLGEGEIEIYPQKSSYEERENVILFALPREGELLRNPDFLEGMNGWFLHQFNGAKAAFKFECLSWRIAIVDPGPGVGIFLLLIHLHTVKYQ